MAVGWLELLTLFVWVPASTALFSLPWLPWARRSIQAGEHRWPAVVISVAVAMAVSSTLGYALLIAHLFSWWAVLTGNALLAAGAWRLTTRPTARPWDLAWTPLSPSMRWSFLGLASASVLWRLGAMLFNPGARGPDTFLHLQFLERALQNIAPTGNSNLYPLGMHAWEGSWALWLDPAGFHLWLPAVSLLLSTCAAALLILHLLHHDLARVAALGLLSWAAFNPFGIVIEKTSSPLPQAPAFALLWVIILLMLRHRDRRGGWVLPLGLATAVAALHNLTALYAGLLLLPALLVLRALPAPAAADVDGSHRADGDLAAPTSRWRRLIADPAPLLVILALPLLVMNQLILTSSVEWRLAFEPVEPQPLAGTVVVNWTTDVPSLTWDSPRELESWEISGVTGGELLEAEEGTAWRLDLGNASLDPDAWTAQVRLDESEEAHATLVLATRAAPPPRFDVPDTLGRIVRLTNTTAVGPGCVVLEHEGDRQETCTRDGDRWTVTLEQGEKRWETWTVRWKDEALNVTVGTIAVWRGLQQEADLDKWLATVPEPETRVALEPGAERPGIGLAGEAPLFVHLDWEPDDASVCGSSAAGVTMPWRDGVILPWTHDLSTPSAACAGTWTLTVEQDGRVAQRQGTLEVEVVGQHIPVMACSDPPVIQPAPGEGTVWGWTDVTCRVTNLGNVPVARTLHTGEVQGMTINRAITSNSTTVLVHGGVSEHVILRVFVQNLPPSTTWSVPILASDEVTWIELAVGTPEVRIETSGQSLIAWAGRFLVWKPDTTWLGANWWWFSIAVGLLLLTLADPRQPRMVRALAAGGLTLQVSQATGILAYPAPWGQARLAELLVLPLALAFVAVPSRWGPVIETRLRERWRRPRQAEAPSSTILAATLVILLILVLGPPSPPPPIAPYALWQAATTAPAGEHVSPTFAGLHSGLSDDPVSFVGAGGLITRWGHAGDPLPDWRCSPEPVSIVLLTDDHTGRAPELQAWLATVRAASPDRWSLADEGSGWERWASHPPSANLTVEVARLPDGIHLAAVDTTDSVWLHDDPSGLSEVSAPVIDPTTPAAGRWWACDADSGRITPIIRFAEL